MTYNQARYHARRAGTGAYHAAIRNRHAPGVAHMRLDFALANAELKYRWTMRQHGYPDAPVPEFSSAGCTLRMEEDHK
jgi:hypothetical protein